MSILAPPAAVAGRRPATRAGSRRVLGVLGVVVLLGAGLAVRLWALSGQPYDFHSDRQLYDVLMARGFWVDLGGAPPAGTGAAVDAARTGIIEPPLVQLLGAVLDRIAGHETLWLVRAVLAAGWVAAAGAVLRLGRSLAGSTAAGVLAAAFWLFTPFAVLASRSFQPDGLALVCGVLAVAALVRDDEEPSDAGWWRAAAWGSAAVLVKLTAVFVVVPVLLALVLRGRGLAGLRERRTVAQLAVVVAPALAYLVAGHVLGFADGQDGGRILPHLLLTGSFWTGWLEQAGGAVGLGGCLVLVVGLVLARDRMRAVLAGLTAGYLAFGLLFTYHYETHSYYHLPLVLPVALAWGLVVVRAAEALRRTGPRPAAVALAVLVALPLGDALVVPSGHQVFAAPSASWSAQVRADREAGAALGHATGVVMLTPDYGHDAAVYGYLAGPAWPNHGDLAKETMEGSAPLSVAGRLSALAAGSTLRWFLVTDLPELDRQPALKAYLAAHFPVGARGPGWVAYRLSAPPAG